MTDQLKALDALIEALEAGTDAPFAEVPDECLEIFTQVQVNMVQRANSGSLDAALALHEGLLPGADWCVSPSRAYAGNGFRGVSCTPARAWLLAILRAYRGTLA